ncbi:aquaporin [Nocardioides sp. AE5]|uniref:MIP/aquaporin family protein n=1 Tax=Nocardioides sp. AE5 TaxID=2962573 RepID=UPI002880C9C3|nr:aquaporin [Nocardioides sp. AE5]MDT0201985.1 aquaporin [Nocardioides sp. AE5]
MTDTETAPPTLAQKIGAEALGTFVLVFFGVGAAMGSGNIVAIALAFGISVMVMSYAVGHISGGHFNPAVSVGAAIAGRLSWIQAGIYAAVQVVSAIVAAAVLFLVFKGFDGWEAKGAMGQNFFGDENTNHEFALWAALIVEIVATAIFLYVILAATDKRNPSAAAAPAAIGLALTGIHLVLIPLTGTSVNPARSIGPALFAGSDAIIQVWLFIVAPLIGAAIAGITYALIFGSDGEPVPGSGLNFGGGNAPASAFAGGWDPNAQQQWGGQPQQQWGGQPQQGWDPNAQQQWGQPDPNAQQQWGAQPDPNAQQQWGQPDPNAQQQWGAQPDPNAQQQWGQPDPNAQQQWGAQPDPNAQQQWGGPEGQGDSSRTQIRPSE